MTNIIPATVDHTELIAQLLSNHFTKLNSVFGAPVYKTEIDVMQRNVHTRISNPQSEFKYFVLINDANEFVGFVNTLHGPKLYEVLMMLFTEGNESEENVQILINFAIERLKESGAPKILAELTTMDSPINKVLSTYPHTVLKQTIALN